MSLPGALARFKRIWHIDFEYIAVDGERPVPVCYVMREHHTGEVRRQWLHGLKRPPAPEIGPSDLMVAYNAAAELGCYLVLGWKFPKNVLDLLAEFRCLRNGAHEPNGIGRSLLHALEAFGLGHIDASEKKSWVQRILAGGPYNTKDRDGILAYCQSDVDALAALLPPLATAMDRTPNWLPYALNRGRYMKGVACMQDEGTPIDMDTYSDLMRHWDGVREALREAIHKQFPIFGPKGISPKLFAPWLEQHGYWWPTTPTGRPKTDSDTLEDMVKVHTELRPIHDLQGMLSGMRMATLPVGRDGRNRPALMPFVAKTGRNAPRGSIFGPSVWMRGLIKPAPGRAIAYLDFKSQENLVAGALSGDAQMLHAYNTGDPYLAFAVSAGLLPADASRENPEHEKVRDICKAIVLGVAYGMGGENLARRAGVTELHARGLLAKHRRVNHVFWKWVESVQEQAQLARHIRTRFGWRMQVDDRTRGTTLLNWPMQANGAEMLRLAVCKLVEAGFAVCMPVHDAVLIEASIENIDATVARAKAIMVDAGRITLGEQHTIGVDQVIVRYPERYMDKKRGKAMWDQVMAALEVLRHA